jgi:heme-degrading monooxygenase HmoA
VSEQVTTISFFKYKTLRNKVWAFGMMQYAHKELAGIEGLSFYRLMGSGKGKGFNPLPNWSVYALLQVWETEAHADRFFTSSNLMREYHSHTEEVWTLYMKTIASVGTWVGKKPFEVGAKMDPNQAIAVITRATIKWNWLIPFWRYVPTSRQALAGNEGLIYTAGVGEVPVVQMATFSLWKDFEAVKNFAYNSKQHKEAITLTRKYDWYKEELFARFQPFKSLGTWNHQHPLDF